VKAVVIGSETPWFLKELEASKPFSTRCRAVRFDVRGVDHLGVCRSPVSGKFPEQIFPDPAPRPAHEAVIDRRRRPIDRIDGISKAIVERLERIAHVPRGGSRLLDPPLRRF
jgi:hypothetical protein